jgi:hypothetical protein
MKAGEKRRRPKPDLSFRRTNDLCERGVESPSGFRCANAAGPLHKIRRFQAEPNTSSFVAMHALLRARMPQRAVTADIATLDKPRRYASDDALHEIIASPKPGDTTH